MFFNCSARYVHIWALSADVVLAEGLLLINTKDLFRLPALYYAIQPWTTMRAFMLHKMYPVTNSTEEMKCCFFFDLT